MAIKFSQLIQQPALKITARPVLRDFYDVVTDAIEHGDLHTEGDSTQTTINELVEALGLDDKARDEGNIPMTDWSLEQDDELTELVKEWSNHRRS